MNEITLVNHALPLEDISVPYWQPPGVLTFAGWQLVGAQLMSAYSNLPWKIGDWINFGEKRYGEAYAQAIQVTGGTYEMLRKWSYVALRIENGTRVPILSWSLHRGVAPLPEYWQKILLVSAQALHLDSRRVYILARTVRGLPGPTQIKLIDRFIANQDPRELVDTLDLCVSAAAHAPANTPSAVAAPALPAALPLPTPPGHRTYIGRIQAASQTIERNRWSTTVGARGLPVIMRHGEHDDLTVHTNTTADAAAWMLADHAYQLTLEVARLAELDRWPAEHRAAETARRLATLAAAHHITPAELDRFRQTAASFSPARRRQSAQICYKHHETIRHLRPADQDDWLDIVERDNLTPAQLRDALPTEDPT